MYCANIVHWSQYVPNDWYKNALLTFTDDRYTMPRLHLCNQQIKEPDVVVIWQLTYLVFRIFWEEKYNMMYVIDRQFVYFQFNFHRNVFQRVQLIMMKSTLGQVMIWHWTYDVPSPEAMMTHPRIHVSPKLDELMRSVYWVLEPLRPLAASNTARRIFLTYAVNKYHYVTPYHALSRHMTCIFKILCLCQFYVTEDVEFHQK